MTACASRSHFRSRNWRPKPALVLVAIALIALCVDQSHPSQRHPLRTGTVFASAQNIVGKFATRTKLDKKDKKKKKKKRPFWRNRSEEMKEDAADDAEDLVCETPEETHTGFFQSVEVGFEDVRMVLRQKKKRKADRVILDGSIRGVAKPGRMLAIMGPSGSGKSTLLHAVSGKVKQDKKISLYGKRHVNGTPLTGDSRIPLAFIEQEVSFFPHMTVKETLDFQVELKMGAVLKTKAERDGLVKDLMNQLGLTKSANTIVGNAKVRGLSGGERKRLSIATEMISSPPLIFLDEPTSGLDSFQATQVIETLRTLANQGKTVVAVIHQPSQHTFQLFDDLLLISEGRQMYFGEISKVRQYMTDLGYGCEPEVGTAEHVLDCVSRAVGADAEAERLSGERIENIATAAKEHASEWVVFGNGGEKEGGSDSGKNHPKKMKHIIDRSAAHPGTNILRQFKLLMGRSVQELLRGKAAIIIKVMQQVSLGLIYGGIYTFDDSQASIMDRFGLLSLIVIGATNMATAQTIRSFPKEKAIVSGEMASGMYRTFPYFISKAISEIPLIGLLNGIFGSIIYPLVRLQKQKGKFQKFLGLTTLHNLASEAVGLLIGSVAPSSDVALALFPPIIILNIIFDGKNISEENTPYLLKWVNKIGLIRWGFTGLAVNEFEGLEFSSSGPFRGPVAKTGQEALARFGLDGKSLDEVVGAQMKVVVGCWLLSFVGLSLTRQKFEVMKNPLK
eukprot:CAMPEP_0172542170 /NCGR_PEP_ID=MMETSP1067-20121228/12831_1 /TAXON_ID=265564 ORGANISM="Thalassiosira punctigera, Strain Tpunct2005C2" /NCGR_SAMPLE_ID=MMETSP1067 /ASSEMBLY_ACC=CAM_ASM_000444 /LENGTH=731 /DNA_ID=CAMNT_0013328349 /DNA_START=37 /DNA_END=2232 /DNA_ORIENTATION=+